MLVLRLLALRLEHAQQDGRIRAELMELLRLMHAESNQSIKTCENGDNQLVWIAGCHFSGRLPLDDQLPKLTKKALAALADQVIE